MTRTYEDLLAAQTELAHFNPNHDPSTGRFSKSKFGKAMAKRKEHREMKKDMDEHFRSQISDEASKVTAIGRNGYDNRGSGWNSAYRKGKVSAKDDREIKKAAANTREYMINKYGEKAVKSFQNKTGESALDPKQRKILKTAGIVALSAAGISILATAGNAVNAQRSLDALGFGDKLITSQVVKAGAKKAGQMALGGALVAIGGHMVKDYLTGDNSKKQKIRRVMLK